MVTEVTKQTMPVSETIVSHVSGVLIAIDKVPTSGNPQDMAASVGMIADIEKAVRKLRAKLLAAIVANATQGGLPLR